MKIITIGRERDNHVITPANDRTVSHHHARISFDGERYVIEDLGSRNGTTVNGQRISRPQVLQLTDIVRVGNQTLPWLRYFDGSVPVNPNSPHFGGSGTDKNPFPNPPTGTTNGFAIAGFVCSFIFPVLGLIFSIIGIHKTDQCGGNGHGLAVAGVVISAAFLFIAFIIATIV